MGCTTSTCEESGRESTTLQFTTVSARRMARPNLPGYQGPDMVIMSTLHPTGGARLPFCVPAESELFRIATLTSQTLSQYEPKAMVMAIQLPAGIRLESWIAAQVLGIMCDLHLLDGLLKVICTCHVLGTSQFAWFWQDDNTETVEQISAKDYCYRLLGYARDLYETRVPLDIELGQDYPETFMDDMKRLVKRAFRIYAHILQQHMDIIKEQQIDEHLKVCFKRLVYVALEFQLISDKDSEALSPLVRKYQKRLYLFKEGFAPEDFSASATLAAPNRRTTLY